jgi:hypothetical protein
MHFLLKRRLVGCRFKQVRPRKRGCAGRRDGERRSLAFGRGRDRIVERNWGRERLQRGTFKRDCGLHARFVSRGDENASQFPAPEVGMGRFKGVFAWL